MSLPTVPLIAFVPMPMPMADRYVTGLVSRRSIRISPTDEDQAWGPDHEVFVMSELELPASNGMLPEDWDMLLAAVTERVRGTASGIDIESVRAALEECVQDLGMLQSTLKPGRQDRKHLAVEAVLQQVRSDLATLPVSRRDGPTEEAIAAGRPAFGGRVETLQLLRGELRSQRAREGIVTGDDDPRI